jgi:hypothetical protein
VVHYSGKENAGGKPPSEDGKGRSSVNELDLLLELKVVESRPLAPARVFSKKRCFQKAIDLFFLADLRFTSDGFPQQGLYDTFHDFRFLTGEHHVARTGTKSRVGAGGIDLFAWCLPADDVSMAERVAMAA